MFLIPVGSQGIVEAPTAMALVFDNQTSMEIRHGG